MSDEVIERIRDAVNIVDVISESVRLTRKGRAFSGLCPFHSEKTPSFIVTPERGSWHCFGCGKGGDVFSFVMENEGMTFPEALEYLAHRAGIELPGRRGQAASKDLYGVMECAVEFYKNELRGVSGSVGRAYLKRRNISLDQAALFELGWAPASWGVLSSALKRDGVTQHQLIQCGLVVQNDYGSCYDRFRGRVIFPIRNVSGRVVAMGGRIVDGDGAKYLNSPEGVLYSKKNNLYLLYKARNAIRAKSRAILVEGYMDAVRLHLCGFEESVASLGTALTEEQAALLKRFTDRCWICYDSDTAGQNATLKGMYVLQHAGLSVFVVQIPEGKDPDELLQLPDGFARFEQAISEAKPLVMYHIELFQQAAKRDGVRASEEFLKSIAQLSAVELAPWMQEIGRAVGLPDYELGRELERLRRGRKEKPLSNLTGHDSRGTSLKREPELPCDDAEAGLVALLWYSRSIRLRVPAGEVLGVLQDPRTLEIAGALLGGSDPQDLEQQWLEVGDQHQMALIARGAVYCETQDGSDVQKLEWFCRCLGRRNMKLRWAALRGKMLRGEASQQEMSEFMQLAQKIKQ